MHCICACEFYTKETKLLEIFIAWRKKGFSLFLKQHGFSERLLSADRVEKLLMPNARYDRIIE